MSQLHSCTLGSIERSLETTTFRLVETHHRPAMKLDRHGHAQAGITFISKGSYREKHDDGELDCRSGMLVFKPPEYMHSNRYGPRGATALHLEIMGTAWLDDIVRLPDKLIATSDARAAYIASALAREFQIDDPVSALTIDALGMEMVSLIFRHSGRSSSAAPPRWLRSSTQFLLDHLNEVPTLRDVAEHSGLPPRKISQAFRRWLGCSVGEFVRRERIEGAANQLRVSKRSIAEIASDYGFCDQSHFTRTFKIELGMTPASYRQQCRIRVSSRKSRAADLF